MFASRYGKLHAWCVALLLVAAVPMVSGCYGRFPLTKMVYKVNGEVHENKFVKSIVFWVFVIFPVYSIASLVDAVAINLIEFWTGNTLNIGTATTEDGTEIAMTPSEDGREAVLTVSRDGQELGQMTFVKVSDSKCEVRDTDGRLIGMALKQASGEILLTNAEGTTIRSLSTEDVATALAM